MISIKITPVPLSRESNNAGDRSGVTNFSISDSSTLAAEDIKQNLGWPFVECMVSKKQYNLSLNSTLLMC